MRLLDRCESLLGSPCEHDPALVQVVAELIVRVMELEGADRPPPRTEPVYKTVNDPRFKDEK